LPHYAFDSIDSEQVFRVGKKKKGVTSKQMLQSLQSSCGMMMMGVMMMMIEVVQCV
jgi:hypothetical protein